MTVESVADAAECENQLNMKYNGFRPLHGWAPARIDPTKITPQVFFKKYVATRTPVVFTTLPQPSARKGPKQKSNTSGGDPWAWLDPKELASAAADAFVAVEPADPSSGQFGSDQERSIMRFDEFMKLLRSGRQDLYHTTQYSLDKPEPVQKNTDFANIPCDPDECDDDDCDCKNEKEEEEVQDDQKELVAADYAAPPLDSLLSSGIPTELKLFGNLVPHLMNVWIGATQKPEGTTSGLHHDFHDNFYLVRAGRKRFTLFSPADTPFMYVNGSMHTVHPNGLQEYCQQLPAGADPKPNRIRADGAFFVDVAAYKMQLANDALDAARTDDDITKAEDLLTEAMELGVAYDIMQGRKDEDDEEDQENEDEEDDGEPPAKRLKSDSSNPPSFSSIDVVALTDAKIALEKFPLLMKATPVTFELGSGESLYLPAGWFHEVRSFGSSKTFKENPDNAIHVALNFWLEPPTESDFKMPYSDNYWRDVRWKSLSATVQAASSKKFYCERLIDIRSLMKLRSSRQFLEKPAEYVLDPHISIVTHTSEKHMQGLSPVSYPQSAFDDENRSRLSILSDSTSSVCESDPNSHVTSHLTSNPPTSFDLTRPVSVIMDRSFPVLEPMTVKPHWRTTQRRSMRSPLVVAAAAEAAIAATVASVSADIAASMFIKDGLETISGFDTDSTVSSSMESSFQQVVYGLSDPVPNTSMVSNVVHDQMTDMNQDDHVELKRPCTRSQTRHETENDELNERSRRTTRSMTVLLKSNHKNHDQPYHKQFKRNGIRRSSRLMTDSNTIHNTEHEFEKNENSHGYTQKSQHQQKLEQVYKRRKLIRDHRKQFEQDLRCQAEQQIHRWRRHDMDDLYTKQLKSVNKILDQIVTSDGSGLGHITKMVESLLRGPIDLDTIYNHKQYINTGLYCNVKDVTKMIIRSRRTRFNVLNGFKFLLPMHYGELILNTQSDFSLPYDLRVLAELRDQHESDCIQAYIDMESTKWVGGLVYHGDHESITSMNYYDGLDKLDGYRYGSVPRLGKYTYIERNIFVDMKRTRDVEIPCSCTIPDDGSPACGVSCVNRCTFVECGSLCPTGEYCTNRTFQSLELMTNEAGATVRVMSGSTEMTLPDDVMNEVSVSGVFTNVGMSTTCGDMSLLELRPSPGCGFGLFTRNAISSGSFIVEYRGEVITYDRCMDRLDTMYNTDTHHYLLDYTDGYVLDAGRKGTCARFINHSCQPNCYIEKWDVLGELRVGVFALRDIRCGEELTYDYCYVSFGAMQRCACGADECSGYIGKKKKGKMGVGSDSGSSNGTSTQSKPSRLSRLETVSTSIVSMNKRGLRESMHGMTTRSGSSRMSSRISVGTANTSRVESNTSNTRITRRQRHQTTDTPNRSIDVSLKTDRVTRSRRYSTH